MGATKSDLFTEKQNRLAQLAKAFAHPARAAIIEQLLERRECICGGLVDELGLAQPTISQHLKELKNIGIIKGTVSGTSVCYCIDEEVWQEMKNRFEEIFYAFSDTEECC